MKLRVGCDIVYIPKFENLVKNGGQKFLDKIFFQEELELSNKIESLAGYFSLKESVFKALDMGDNFWHKIKIYKSSTGKPQVLILQNLDFKILSYDVSISHDGDYTYSNAIFLLNYLQ